MLGPIEVDDHGPVALGGPRQLAVLAVLVAAWGRPVASDAMVTEVWGDAADRRAVASLYTYISNLRGLIGKDRIVRDASGYRLALANGDVIDAVAFESDATVASGLTVSSPSEAALRYRDALARWRGRPFEGLEDVPVLEAERARLDDLRADAEIDRFEAVLRAGEHPPVGEIEGLCRRRALDERAWALLMRTQYLAGRQADALRTYARVRSSFGEELGIEPSPMLQRLEEQMLLHDPSLDPTHQPPPLDLPVFLTTFVGRLDERRSLIELVRNHRIVTVIGPGGAGKTRLAVEVASEVADQFPDGVWLADLAKLSSPHRLEATIGTAMGVANPSADATYGPVIDAHRSHEGLLVLDNCEHMQEATGDAARAMLEGVPGLTILATSRVPLGCPGETRFPLEGLTVGSPDAASTGDAETLFLERSGRVVRPNGDDPPLATVTTLCERLDGMPLALELAASRTDVLSEGEIADLLSQRFSVLVDQGRSRDIHRSLAATIGWSYGLLDLRDRAAFASLGVFAGPFSASAAAQVIGVDDEQEAIAFIERLINASLVSVQRRTGRLTTYRLLETLRAYAKDRLIESGDEAAATRRHDDHYVEVCRRLGDAFYGAGRVAATAMVGTELAEFIETWNRSMSADAQAALELAWPLGNYWLFDGGLADGAHRLRALIARTDGDTSPARADALTIAAWVLVTQNEVGLASIWAAQAVDLARPGGDSKRLAYALARAGHFAFATGDFEPAMAMLGESLEVCDRIGYEDGKAWPITLIAQARRWSGDDDPEIRDLLLDARRQFIEIGETYGQTHADMLLGTFTEFDPEIRAEFATEMVELGRRQGGDNTILPIALHNLAYPAWFMHEYERAWGLNRLAVRAAMASGMIMNLGLALLQGAMFEAERGDTERAAVMFGAGTTHFGMQLAPFQEVMLAPAREASAAALGKATYDELRRIGLAMNADEAAAYALRGAA